MKERISQIASGIVDVETPALEILVPRIEETVAAGQNFRGDIRISSGNGLPFRGLIYSDDSRVALLQNSFAGTSAFLSYEVRAEQMDPGTEVAGSFCLVYNGGEQKIPYSFRVRENVSSRDGLPHTLEEFAELAKEHPAEAAELAESRSFPRLSFMDDPSLRALYDGLHRAKNRSNLTEEFLVASGAKERVLLSVSEEALELREHGTKESALTVTRNTWGAFQARIRAEDAWLIPEREQLTEADFTGMTVRIGLRADAALLHAGKNCTRLHLDTPFRQIVIPVTLVRPSAGSDAGRKRERRREYLHFMNLLLEILAGRRDTRQNLDELQTAWEEMTAEREPGARDKLYRAAISLWREDRELASMILDDAEREIQDARREDADTYLAYLYLRMQVSESWEQKEQLFKILTHYRENGQDSVFLFLLFLHLDESAADRPQGTLAMLEVYYRRGCRSPFLYLEAVRILNRHPDVLREFTPFSCAVLSCAARRGYLTAEAAAYVASLAVHTSEYTGELTDICRWLYRTHKTDELLSAVCGLLIRAQDRRETAFPWFAEGVARDIRQTKLYDYYLYTASREQAEAFPREIVLYFSYNSPRDPQSQKLLYGNLLKFYEKDRQIMDSYQGQMRKFVLACARAGVMDGEMAPLYERLLETSDIDDRMAAVLPDILNAVEIRRETPAFTGAVLVYGELEEEFSAPFRGDTACLPAYTESAQILLTAEDGTRSAGTACSVRRLMEHTKALKERCMELCPKHGLLRLTECRRILGQEHKTEAELRQLKRELDARGIHRQFKKELVSAIVDAAIRRAEPSEDEILACVHYGSVSREQRLILTEILIREGRLAEAERQVRRIGYRDLPEESLKRLAQLSIQNGLYTKDELLLDMCRTLVKRGQADDLVLEYLCTHFNSSSADMVPILEMADARKLQLSDMPERLLAQMLFTGCYTDMDRVFQIYRDQEPAEDLLTQAYYVVKCSAYFYRGEPAGEGTFLYVEESLHADRGRSGVPEICRLALMRHYAEKELLTPEETERCGRLLGGMIRRGMLFAWMRGLEGKVRLPEEIRCREWIEFHGAPDQHLELVARILPERKDRVPLRLIFPEVVPGIYVKPFLLFAGEELEWEICRGGKVLSAGHLTGRESPESDHSRFAELNRLQALVQSGGQIQEVQDAVVEYGRKEAWVETLFTLGES